MKKFIPLISLATLFVVLTTNIEQVSAKSFEAKSDSVQIWCSPDLAEIASSWASGYTRINPEIKLGLKIAGKDDIPELMEKPEFFWFFSSDFFSGDKNVTVRTTTVGREIIVPVMNTKNPFLNQILQQGIAPAQFAEVFAGSSNPTWGKLLDDGSLNSVGCACFVETYIDSNLSEFLKTNQDIIHYSKVLGKEGFVTEILNNPNSIGFCRLTDVLDPENQELLEGISLVPIDMNSNKKVDYFEDIYTNSGDLARGIWIGKYPRALYQNIYALSGIQPAGETNLEFLEWILTGGQSYLYSAGYSELVFNERKSKLEDLTEVRVPIVDAQTKSNHSGMILIIIGLLVVGGFILFLVINYFGGEKKEAALEDRPHIPVFGEHSVTAPAGLFFDKSHTWAFMEKEGTVRIGIDDFLQHVTGSITKVKMRNPGEKIRKGEPFLSLIQYGKQLDIKSPVSGTILERNKWLQTESSILNISPYGEGWVYLMKSDNWLKEIKSLFMGESYQAWLQYEFSRLKDFLSYHIKSKSLVNLPVVLQEGGEMKDHLLEEFGPQVWEEFQNDFINGAD
ncbi:MAG: hypothetical protein WC341_08815 [Bacteroidales bacterium]|jgi:glycine cleavage system H lipoate-binding protein/ABC-type phosphate transport system substrate-binding protein